MLMVQLPFRSLYLSGFGPRLFVESAAIVVNASTATNDAGVGLDVSVPTSKCRFAAVGSRMF